MCVFVANLLIINANVLSISNKKGVTQVTP